MKAFVRLALFFSALMFIAGVVSDRLDKVNYESSGGSTRIVKRSNTPKPPPKCLCAQALADFGQECNDPSCLVGTVHFTQNPCGQSTFTGTFISGFEDTSANYSFVLSDAAEKDGDNIDLTPFVNFNFFKGGLKTFQATTPKFTLNCGESSTRPGVPGAGPAVTGRTLFIRRRNTVIGKSLVKGRR